MNYRADFEFQRHEQIATGTAGSRGIVFEADSDEDAVRDAAAWWANRHAAVPEMFALCLSIVIHTLEPRRIDANGYLSQCDGIARRVFQWKSSTGLGPSITHGTSLDLGIGPTDWPMGRADNARHGFAGWP